MLYLANFPVQYSVMPMPTEQPESQRPAPGRPKDPAKRAAILDAAQRLFLAGGFDHVSMDQIAADAGVSKLTLYSHFGDKEALYIAAVEYHCGQQVPAALFTPDPGTPIRQRLIEIGRAVFTLVASPEALAGLRLMCTPRMDSRLPALFWNAGAGRLQAEFAELLGRRTAAGELAIDDTARASSQFFALLRGDLHLRLLLGCADVREFDVDAHLEATVDLFLRAHARPPARTGGRRQAR
jgi:TetR/AcrR family transcriptional repressor of mexJK operon